MLLKNLLEPIPTKKITYKKSHGYEYVYYTTRAYRNKYGKPTSDEVAIGRKDTVTGQLIPNERFYELFPERKQIPTQSTASSPTTPQVKELTIDQIKISGVPATLLEVANKTKLLEVLQRCFPDKWKYMLTIAFYLLDHSSSMMYIDDWTEDIELNLVDFIDGFMCSKIFSSITHEERQYFFREWIKCRGEQEYIAYDVTSISTYSKNIEDAEWGYNRDNDKLQQVNYGMFYGITTKMPVYYNMYSGSIPDKSCLEYMLINVKNIGVEKFCLVIDRGFPTNDNISFMFENDIPFISAMPMYRNDAKALINDNFGKTERMENWISEYQVYGARRSFTVGCHTIQAHIYFDNVLKTKETNEHHAYIEKLREELKEISKQKKMPKRYDDNFIITELSKNEFTFELDLETGNRKLERMGYFILLSSDPDINSYDILKTYRDKDTVEKHFDQLKNGLEFKRLKTHNQKTTEGKIFIGFLALILRSYILQTVKRHKDTKHFTFEKIMTELRKIKSVFTSNCKKIVIPLTSTQKNIMFRLGITEDMIKLL